jgi:UDP:flavonoid glycosyltransferase YjiC (YdhE family)
MHIGLFTFGSRGDVQPFIVLAKGLMHVGDQCTLYAPENYKDFVEASGVSYSPLSGNVDAILNSPEGLRVLKTGNALSMLKFMQRGGREIQHKVNQDLLEGCNKVDVIISSVLCYAWICCIAEKLNKKWALVNLSLPTTPTRSFPFAGMAFLQNPLFNKFTYLLLQYVYWQLNKKDINAFRQSIGLPAREKNITHVITTENILNIYAISPTLVQRPNDWPTNTIVTGYIHNQSNEDLHTSSDNNSDGLANWIVNGAKPVYLGWGSMPIPDKDKVISIIKDILENTQYRLLFCKGLNEGIDLPAHPRLFVTGQVIHQWVLPQCRLAIFHGGTGTIHAVLRAGIPAIVSPVFADQPWWGKLIKEKKLGTCIPFKKLNTKQILNAIKLAEQETIQQHAAAVGESMRLETGLQHSIDAIKLYLLTGN